MKRFLRIIPIVIALLLLVFTLLPFPLTQGSETKVHLSFDDVWFCFNDLVENKDCYNSIFDNAFICSLKKAHDNYGCKFTLYTYSEGLKGYRIETMPSKYKQDFEASSEWLKIGFHASNPSISRDQIADTTLFVEDYTRVANEVRRFAGDSSISKILRLHYFYATEEEVSFLTKEGVLCG